jgi:C4-dicarboxylate-specific signal transduction histidine kinase
LRWLRRDIPDLEEVSAAINRVVTEGRRAGAIVARIRSFLKKAPADHDVLAIGEIIDDAALLVDRELAKENVTLTVEVAPGLPPIRGDRVQLQQVLVNLLVNAGQAMSEQDGPRIASVQAGLTEGDILAITVKDTGPGIAADDLARLFKPFFTTRQDGMGMGLAICRTTVESHGGKLTVESSRSFA